MDSRLLIRMAAPLVLTLLAPIAVGFEWPAPVRWAILTTLTLSWFGFAAWLLLRGVPAPGRSAEHLRLVREQDQLLSDLRGEWETPPHKPVSQQSMGAGTVELF